MMKWLVIVAVAMVAVAFAVTMARAEPFLHCDPQAGVTHYRITWIATGVEEMGNAQADGSSYHDLAGVPVGDNAGEIQACNQYTLDGVPQLAYRCSDPTPLFIRKSAGHWASNGLRFGRIEEWRLENALTN